MFDSIIIDEKIIRLFVAIFICVLCNFAMLIGIIFKLHNMRLRVDATIFMLTKLNNASGRSREKMDSKML